MHTDLSHLNVTTSTGECFSGEKVVKLASLIFDRFGKSGSRAVAAWNRLHESDLSEDAFYTLLNESTGIDFDQIRHLGAIDSSKAPATGGLPLWPGKVTYAFASNKGLNKDGPWFARLRHEANAHGMAVKVHDGNVYFVWMDVKDI